MRFFRHMLHNDDSGWTIPELITVAAILPIILSLGYLVLNSTSGMADRINTRSQLSEDTRYAVDLMTRELRQAMEPTANAGVFATAQPYDCAFFCDVNHDGVPEKVDYYQSGTQLRRAQASSLTSVPPYRYGAYAAYKVLAPSIANPATAPIFRYYNSSGAVMGATQSAQISAVGIKIVSQGRPHSYDSTVTASQTTWVKIRSVFNNIY